MKLTPEKRGGGGPRIKPGTSPTCPPIPSRTCDIDWAVTPYPYRPMVDDVPGLCAHSAFITVVCCEIKWLYCQKVNYNENTSLKYFTQSYKKYIAFFNLPMYMIGSIYKTFIYLTNKMAVHTGLILSTSAVVPTGMPTVGRFCIGSPNFKKAAHLASKNFKCWHCSITQISQSGWYVSIWAGNFFITSLTV